MRSRIATSVSSWSGRRPGRFVPRKIGGAFIQQKVYACIRAEIQRRAAESTRANRARMPLSSTSTLLVFSGSRPAVETRPVDGRSAQVAGVFGRLGQRRDRLVFRSAAEVPPARRNFF
jgi:hypothetical protein